jgi:hypothetical protein
MGRPEMEKVSMGENFVLWRVGLLLWIIGKPRRVQTNIIINRCIA